MRFGPLLYCSFHVAVAQLPWNRESIDTIIFVSSAPDYKTRATACVLQHRLGLSRDCAAFDVNLGCSGYVYGLWLAASMLSQAVRRVLLVNGNQVNSNVNADDRSTAMLFGDAGAATAIEADEGRLAYSLKSDGSRYTSIVVPAGAARNRSVFREPYLHADGTLRSDWQYHMNGAGVFEFTITEGPADIAAFMQRCDIQDVDVDWYGLHQANEFMLSHISRKLGVKKEKVPLSLREFGKTSGASTPLTPVTQRDRWPGDRLRLLCPGFGVGLSWAAACLAWDRSVVCELVETEEVCAGNEQ